MQEHAAELVGLLISIVIAFGALVIWFIKRDRKAIDVEIAKLHGEIENVKSCLEKDVEEAMNKVSSIEHNYIARLDAIKDSVTDLKVSIASMFGDLKATLAREYMSKEEAERAYNHIRGLGKDV